MLHFFDLIASVYSRRNKEPKGGSPVKREKSCGALVYRITQNGQKELLFIKHRHGTHWSFPKGHMEEGENEVQTALREVKEETGLDIDLEGDFRQSVEYYPKPNVKKLWSIFWDTPETITWSVRRRRSAKPVGFLWSRPIPGSLFAMTKI